MTRRVCIICEHHRGPGWVWDDAYGGFAWHRCAVNRRTDHIDVVTGRQTVVGYYKSCNDMRTRDQACGPLGKLFVEDSEC